MSSTIRVWVRLANQAAHEAIKLLLPRDGSDISDVLLQVPTALNVSGYRPSELALHLVFDRDGGEGVEPDALSNRTSLEDLLERVHNANELNLEVRSKVGAVPAQSAPSEKPAASQSRVTPTRQAVPQRAPSPSALPLVPKAVPARTASPFRRTASTMSTRAAPNAPSVPFSRTGSTQRSTSAPRAPSGQRAASPKPSGTTAHTENGGLARRASPLRTASASPSMAPSPRPAPSTPHVATVLTKHQRSAPQPQTPQSPQQHRPATARHPLVPSCANRRAVPSTTVSRASSSSSQPPAAAVPLHAVPVSAGVCDHFKAQWGNVLCATCKHSKQAHTIKQRQQQRVEARHRLSAASLDTSSSYVSHQSPARSMDRHVDPASTNENHGMHHNVGTDVSASPTPSSVGNRSDMNLLEPPVVSNLSLGSPDGPSFDRQ
jgi:hypothetical protein